MFIIVLFYKQKTAYDGRISDWSSDVCSSDLLVVVLQGLGQQGLLVLEVEDGHALGEARSIGDRGQGGRRETMLDNGIDSRLDELPPQLGRILGAPTPLPARRCPGCHSVPLLRGRAANCTTNGRRPALHSCGEE